MLSRRSPQSFVRTLSESPSAASRQMRAESRREATVLYWGSRQAGTEALNIVRARASCRSTKGSEAGSMASSAELGTASLRTGGAEMTMCDSILLWLYISISPQRRHKLHYIYFPDIAVSIK